MIKIVYNKLLRGWYVVRGPHQFPLAGPFASREEAKAWRSPQQARDLIAALKHEARGHNRAGRWSDLNATIKHLERVWKDDQAAHAFYTELEQEAERLGLA